MPTPDGSRGGRKRETRSEWVLEVRGGERYERIVSCHVRRVKGES